MANIVFRRLSFMGHIVHFHVYHLLCLALVRDRKSIFNVSGINNIHLFSVIDDGIGFI